MSTRRDRWLASLAWTAAASSAPRDDVRFRLVRRPALALQPRRLERVPRKAGDAISQRRRCHGAANVRDFVDELRAQLLAANVPTELRVYPGAFHGSPSLVPDSELSRRWRRDELSALDRALNDPR